MMNHLKLIAIVCTVWIGGQLSFQDDFLPLSTAINNPIIFVIIFSPTIIFGAITFIGLLKKNLDIAVPFSVGLLVTGLFNNLVAMKTAGNPGYMVPIGHLMAPFVSLTAYLLAFSGKWVIKFLNSKPKRKSA